MIRLDERGFPAEITESIQEGLESAYLDMGFVDIPQPPGMDYQWINGEWIAASRLTLEDVRLNKSREIEAACKLQIVSGFDSESLGECHHYPAKPTDQLNLSGSVVDSLLPDLPVDWLTPFWCSDANGLWEFRLHTASQIQQVGRDAKAAIIAAMGKNEQLQAVIAAAGTMAEIEAVGW